jgi:hypothetical protein
MVKIIKIQDKKIKLYLVWLGWYMKSAGCDELGLGSENWERGNFASP